MFTPLQRRLGVIWVVACVPMMGVYGLFATTPDRYIFIFVFLASGAFTAPALFVAVLGTRQAPPREKGSYALAAAGLAVIFVIGLGMLANLRFGWTFANPIGPVIVSLAGASIVMAAVTLTRRRSGDRALSVDLVEAAMALLVVLAPAILIWGERVVRAEEAWFTIPAACGGVATVFAAYWTAAMLVRGGPEAGPLEGLAVALALTGTVDAGAQVAQGLSGFTLPASPLLVLHAICMSQLLLLPLFLRRTSLRGLDRMPPQAQVRGGALAAILTLAGLPVLLLTTLALADEQSWTVPFSLAVMTLLLLLAAGRHLLNVRETQRLYGHLESASEERRALLAQVMRRVDDDRHRVAAELHEQAVSAYASFVSFIQAVGAPTPAGGAGSVLTGASTLVRDDLARHAESLRHLMLAIKPLEPATSGAPTLTAPIDAFVDSLYGDRVAPACRRHRGRRPGARLDLRDDRPAHHPGSAAQRLAPQRRPPGRGHDHRRRARAWSRSGSSTTAWGSTRCTPCSSRASPPCGRSPGRWTAGSRSTAPGAPARRCGPRSARRRGRRRPPWPWRPTPSRRPSPRPSRRRLTSAWSANPSDLEWPRGDTARPGDRHGRARTRLDAMPAPGRGIASIGRSTGRAGGEPASASDGQSVNLVVAYSQVTRHAVSGSIWPARQSSTLARAKPSMPALAATTSPAGPRSP